MTISCNANKEGNITVRFTYGPLTAECTEAHPHAASFWAQLGRELHQHPDFGPQMLESQAREGYRKYTEHCGGKAFNGDTLPVWDDIEDQAIRDHWIAVFS